MNGDTPSSTDSDSLYDHVGHDFSRVHKIIKSLTKGNSTTVADLIQCLSGMQQKVQAQEYDESVVKHVHSLLEDLDDEARNDDCAMTPELAETIKADVEHALEAYRVAAQKKEPFDEES